MLEHAVCNGSCQLLDKLNSYGISGRVKVFGLYFVTSAPTARTDSPISPLLPSPPLHSLFELHTESFKVGPLFDVSCPIATHAWHAYISP